MTAWPHIRAVLVALHVVAITAMALPAVPRTTAMASTWADPTVQEEIRAWAARLHLEPAMLEERARRGARHLIQARDAALAPFGPYYRHCGTWQSWRMFVAPHRYPARLEIEVKRDGAWHTLHRAGDPNTTWHRAQVRHVRMRSTAFITAWERYADERSRLADWVARTVAAEDPNASAIRLRYWKQRTPAPGAPPEQGTWIGIEERQL